MSIVEVMPKLTDTLFQCFHLEEKFQGSPPLGTTKFKFVSLITNLSITKLLSLHYLFKIYCIYSPSFERPMMVVKLLTVEVSLGSWVHHLKTFSSGVLMFFNAILPPWFLVHNFQNRVTCTNKPSSHTVSFACV